MDPGLNSLLKWSVENSTTTSNDPDAAPPSNRGLNPDVINSLFGGPSDADLMVSSMSAITSEDTSITLDDKMIAFDNFEQLIENLDNANNLGPLALWTPLLDCLSNKEKEMRKMAAWCVGTAVQNNETSQERLLAMGGVEQLTRLAVKKEEDKLVRRKVIYALSSACRNYQPSMDAFTAELERLNMSKGKVDASDMDACDAIFEGLREDAAAGK